MILFDLFVTFAKIGAFSFGGGYAMLPLIQREIVTAHKWLDLPQFIDIIAIAECTPGPIAINSATFVGYRVAGFWGSFFATFGVVFPSFVIILILAYLFFRYRNLATVKAMFSGIRPAVGALITAAALSIISSAIVDLPTALLSAAVALAAGIWDVDPILLLVLSGIAGVLLR